MASDLHTRIISSVIQKQERHNRQLYMHLLQITEQTNDSVFLKHNPKQPNTSIKNSFDILCQSIFVKQSAANLQLRDKLCKETAYLESRQQSRHIEQQQKDCPSNQKLKPIKVVRESRFKGDKADANWRYKSDKIKFNTEPQQILVREKGSLQGRMQSKNALISQELRKKDHLIELLKRKNKLQTKLYQLNEQLWIIKKLNNRSELSTNTVSPEKPQRQQAPTYQTRHYRNRKRFVSHPSINPFDLGCKNPQKLHKQLEDSQKALRFIAKISEQSTRRKLKLKKRKQNAILQRIGDINLNCSRHRCSVDIIEGKIRELQ